MFGQWTIFNCKRRVTAGWIEPRAQARRTMSDNISLLILEIRLSCVILQIYPCTLAYAIAVSISVFHTLPHTSPSPRGTHGPVRRYKEISPSRPLKVNILIDNICPDSILCPRRDHRPLVKQPAMLEKQDAPRPGVHIEPLLPIARQERRRAAYELGSRVRCCRIVEVQLDCVLCLE